MFKSYINNLQQQLDTLGQEKLKMEANLAICKGWWRTSRINMRG